MPIVAAVVVRSVVAERNLVGTLGVAVAGRIAVVRGMLATELVAVVVAVLVVLLVAVVAAEAAAVVEFAAALN